MNPIIQNFFTPTSQAVGQRQWWHKSQREGGGGTGNRVGSRRSGRDMRLCPIPRKACVVPIPRVCQNIPLAGTVPNLSQLSARTFTDFHGSESWQRRKEGQSQTAENGSTGKKQLKVQGERVAPATVLTTGLDWNTHPVFYCPRGE